MDDGMTNPKQPRKAMSGRKLRTGLIALLFFMAFGFLGLLLGFGRGGVSAGALGG
jgi:hypothetical protein